jgi:hypothetical protein
MVGKYTSIVHYNTLQNSPKLGFLFWKYTIWQPWWKQDNVDNFSIRQCVFQINKTVHHTGVVGQTRLLRLLLASCPDHSISVRGMDWINRRSKSGSSRDPSPSVYFPSGRDNGLWSITWNFRWRHFFSNRAYFLTGQCSQIIIRILYTLTNKMVRLVESILCIAYHHTKINSLSSCSSSQVFAVVRN